MKTDIEEIILSKAYEELNDEEIKLIQTEISSQEEYNNIRFFLMTMDQSKQEEKSISPELSKKDQLLKEFDKKYESHPETKVAAINYFRWQKLSIAAVVIFGLILSFYVYKNFLKEAPKVAGHQNKIEKKNSVQKKNSDQINATNSQINQDNKNRISNFVIPNIIDTAHHNYIAINNNKIDSSAIVKTSRTLGDDEMLSELLFTAL